MKDDHDRDPHVIMKHTAERDLDAMMAEDEITMDRWREMKDAAENAIGEGLHTGEWKIYRRHYAARRILQYLKRRESTSRTALFVVGPGGSGKSTTVAHVIQEVSDKEPHYLPLELDFETYFIKDAPGRSDIDAETMRRQKLSFDNFVENFFYPMIARELCKIPLRLAGLSSGSSSSSRFTDIFGVDAVYEILTERMSIHYSMRKYLQQHPDLSQIESIAQYLQQHSISETLLDKNLERHMFRLICSHYHEAESCNSVPQFDNIYLQHTCNAIYFAMELVEKREVERAVNGGRSGTEALNFFITTMEYLAFRDPFQDILQPKLFICGLHMLDVFSRGVELRHRNEIFQQRFDEKQDYRGPDLHDHFLLRIAVTYHGTGLMINSFSRSSIFTDSTSLIHIGDVS